LNTSVEDRAKEIAEYIIEHNATVRSAASKFGISKSTVHKDISERLERRSPLTYSKVKAVLERNKAERHIRGGEATRLKYKGIKP